MQTNIKSSDKDLKPRPFQESIKKITNICNIKRSFIVSSFDYRYQLIQGLFEDTILCYNTGNTAQPWLNALTFTTIKPHRVLSFPYIKSGAVTTAICKINLWERGKRLCDPLSNCSMNRRLHFVPLSTAIISKVRKQVFIYNFLKSLKTECFWYCKGHAIMKDGSVNHVGHWFLNGTWEKNYIYYLKICLSTQLKHYFAKHEEQLMPN